jgi:hypothetical protein
MAYARFSFSLSPPNSVFDGQDDLLVFVQKQTMVRLSQVKPAYHKVGNANVKRR